MSETSESPLLQLARQMVAEVMPRRKRRVGIAPDIVDGVTLTFCDRLWLPAIEAAIEWGRDHGLVVEESCDRWELTVKRESPREEDPD